MFLLEAVKESTFQTCNGRGGYQHNYGGQFISDMCVLSIVEKKKSFAATPNILHVISVIVFKL